MKISLKSYLYIAYSDTVIINNFGPYFMNSVTKPEIRIFRPNTAASLIASIK